MMLKRKKSMLTYLTPEELKKNSHFIDLCEKNDVEGVELILNQRKMFSRNYLSYNHAFSSACKNNAINVVNILSVRLKNILNYELIFRELVALSNLDMLKYLKAHEPQHKDFWDNCLIIASEIDNLDLFKYVLEKTSKDIPVLHSALVKACSVGILTTVKFLLREYSLDIHRDYDLALRVSAREKQMEMVRFLLTDETLVEKANPNALNDDLYISAIMLDNKVVLDFLENEYKLEKSQFVQDYILSKQ
jgi:hypothetical protein